MIVLIEPRSVYRSFHTGHRPSNGQREKDLDTIADEIYTDACVLGYDSRHKICRYV